MTNGHPSPADLDRPRPVPAPPGAADDGLADRTVAQVRARLAELDGLETADHVAVFDAVHRELADVLGRLDRDPEPGGPGGKR
ncbi:hypothetical protein [Marinactinospora rubrisoli]|uniref:Uncharacterized protein n=1 Tax=Marinactinospora rubrisoli TaxID=2715399 RepID=A0ABW2KN34_9ACTN